MKNILMLLVVCLALYGGYSLWQQKQTQPATPTEIGREEPKPTPAPEPPTKTEVSPPVVPEPVVPVAPIVPAAPVKRLGAEGVYYVIQPISLTTDEGVVGIKVGTGVRLVEDLGETLKVTDGKNEFVAKKHQLSNDLDQVAQFTAANSQAVSANANLSREREQAAAAMDSQKAAEATAGQQAAQQRIYCRGAIKAGQWASKAGQSVRQSRTAHSRRIRSAAEDAPGMRSRPFCPTLAA